MNNSYLTLPEARIINDLMPGNQNLQLGSKLRNALNLGMGIKNGSKFYVDGTNGSDTDYDGLSWDTAFKTIQHAVDSCGNGRGDVIFVAPMRSAKYTENVLILEHQSIKILAPWGPWTTRMRASDGTTKYAITPVGGIATSGCAFVVLSRDVEIAGFGIDGGGGYCGIYCGDGYRISATYDENSAGCYFHDNYFLDASNYGIILDGCSANVMIENNVFERYVYAGVEVGPGGSRTVQRPIIRGNTFLGKGHGVHLYDSATTVGVQVIGNTFVDFGGVMTYSCLFQGAGVHAFMGNHDCTAAGALGSATDFMSGNTEAHAMNVPVYIAEA
jgi:parallel beta-helix repeat protein